MDDFLHNLRTGKNKPFDRTRKQYDNNGYKNPERQGIGDNRRKEPFQRTPPVDHLPAIKSLLGEIAEGQRRQAEIGERRVLAEERIASAMERIAAAVFDKIQSSFSAKPDILEPVKPEINSLPADPSAAAASATHPEIDRSDVIEMIGALRKEQFSYEKIARTLEEKGVPTFSGKGAWHSQTVSKLCHQFHPSLYQ